MHDSTKTDPLTELFGEVISTYSRAQALDDGVLVDAGPYGPGGRLPLARGHHRGGLGRLCGLD